ncbi:hypothetical protein Tco_1033026 [Tanacetum coccineum]|uniref:Uncharacterized protein n=1 Tax=Tanacetum coccineum TaxID=301880 RepID=A0ABQ5GEU7_9ASTR
MPAAVLPTANSPWYIPESDLEEDPKEDNDEDPKEDLADYPTDRDEEDEPFGDEADNEDEDDKEEEETHPALADSVPPPPVHRTLARISIPTQGLVPFLSKEEVERFLAIPTPTPSPLTLLSSPYKYHLYHCQIQSCYDPAEGRVTIYFPFTTIYHTLIYQGTYGHDEGCCTIHLHLSTTIRDIITLPIPLPTPSPPLLIPSTDRRADKPEICLPPRKRLCITQGPRYEVGESSSVPRPTGGFRTDYGFVATLDVDIRRDPERDVGYETTDTWDEMLVGMPGAPATDDTELGRRMIEFATMVRQDTDEIYERLDEAQDARAVLSGRLNLLQRDRHSYAYTALLMEREARLSLEAWGWSMAASDTAHSKVMALRTTVLGQQAEIAALRASDHARQA